MSKKNTNYTATLTLTQTGLDGEIYSSIKFDPVMSEEDIDENGELIIPASYGLMSIAAEAYLTAAGILDDDGNVVDEDVFRDIVDIEASGNTLN